MAWIARLSSTDGFAVVKSDHAFFWSSVLWLASVPGSNEGVDAIARMAPVEGWIATTAPV